jgi:hypothetical protein
VSGPDHSHVSLQAYPARDASFAREVHDVINAVSTEEEYDEARIGDLEAVVQARLRNRYPNAIIHAQDPFARLRDPDVMLYAYRDGRIRPEDPRRERLYRALQIARTTCDESRRIVDQSEVVGSIWAGTGHRVPVEDAGQAPLDISPSRRQPHPGRSAPPDR